MSLHHWRRLNLNIRIISKMLMKKNKDIVIIAFGDLEHHQKNQMQRTDQEKKTAWFIL